MADVIRPDTLNENFTLYLNVEGKPVQRPLRAMTADEVLLALKWHTAEADRLQAEVEPWTKVGELIAAGRMDEVQDLSPAELEAAGESCKAAAAASLRASRLMARVMAQCPKRYEDTPLQSGLRRWWSGGRRKA